MPARGMGRILDLGTGDGRLLGLLLGDRRDVVGVGVDISKPMLEAARERFGDDGRVTLLEHDLADPLPARELGFGDVDCLWKWREMALLVGVKPPAT